MVRRATTTALPEDFDIHVIARPERQLRRQEVEVITGLSASSIYRLLGTGDFPRPLRITPRCVRWLEIRNRPLAGQPGQNRFPNLGELMGVSSKKASFEPT
jgi:prophage regulatory protein